MGFRCNRKDCPYKQEIERLKEEIALLRFELEELRAKRYKSGKKKSEGEQQPKNEPKKRGGVFGHIGWFRKKPKRVDKIENVSLTKCPHCGSKDIKGYKHIEEHTQQDIILPEVETTLFRKRVYYCGRCKKTVMGRGENELPNSHIGPLAKAWAVFLKHGVKISDRDIQNIFKVLGLELVTSSIVGFRDQLRREAASIYEELKQALKRGKFVHVDETGSRVDGENVWRFKFSNKKVSVTHTDQSRGQKVVEEILGTEYDGILISDFLSAYNKIITKAKQKCLVHLLRDLKTVIEYWHTDEEVLRYCKELKNILEGAIQLHKDYKNRTWDNEYCRKRERITQRLNDFSFPNPNKKILCRFAKRLNRHKDELFTFLYHKDIDYHNNHAEQQIRPDVLLRKVTFGNRSEKGAQVHDVVMSVLQTAKLNALDPVRTFQTILLSNKKNPFAKILVPP